MVELQEEARRVLVQLSEAEQFRDAAAAWEQRLLAFSQSSGSAADHVAVEMPAMRRSQQPESESSVQGD